MTEDAVKLNAPLENAVVEPSQIETNDSSVTSANSEEADANSTDINSAAPDAKLEAADSIPGNVIDSPTAKQETPASQTAASVDDNDHPAAATDKPASPEANRSRRDTARRGGRRQSKME